MTKAIAGVWSDDTPTDVTSVDDALEVFDDLTESYSADGQRGALASWWGPPIGWEAATSPQRVNGPLRIDMWPDLDRAVVRWEPTGEFATQPGVDPPTQALTSMESAHEGTYASIDPTLIRCSIAGARQAAAEFAGTLRKPESLRWEAVGAALEDVRKQDLPTSQKHTRSDATHLWQWGSLSELGRRMREGTWGPLRMSYTVNHENILVICHQHHEALETFRRFRRDTRFEGVLRVEFDEDDAVRLDIVTHERTAAVQYVNQHGAWFASPTVRDRSNQLMQRLRVLFAERDPASLPEDLSIPVDSVEEVLEEFIDAPNTPPHALAWVKAS